MDIKVISSNGYTVVSIEGRIDTTNAGDFEKAIMKVVEEKATKIILDCCGLQYISSSGLRIFLILQKKMMAVQGTLRLCNLQPEIQEIFDISGFSSIFSIFPNLDSAIS
jgi:anti-anti-sigma factor